MFVDSNFKQLDGEKMRFIYVIFLFIPFLPACRVGQEWGEPIQETGFEQVNGEYRASVADLDDVSFNRFSGQADIQSIRFEIEDQTTGQGEAFITVPVDEEDTDELNLTAKIEQVDLLWVEVEGSTFIIETGIETYTFEIISETAVSDENGAWYSLENITRREP